MVKYMLVYQAAATNRVVVKTDECLPDEVHLTAYQATKGGERACKSYT